MKNRFNAVHIESDKRIPFKKEGKLGAYDVRHEIWSWDGYKGESFFSLVLILQV